MFSLPALTKPVFVLRRVSRQLWVRMTLIAVLALVAAGSSTWLQTLLPPGLSGRIDEGAVARILEILAASMLTVTTFSLSVMVAARQWASSQSTPRAQKLMREDTITQNALATFLGAFVFALVSYILLTTGAYAGGSEAVILGFTLVVVALVVIAILRWIHHLTSLGGVDQTADRLEDATEEALRLRRSAPFLGACPLTEDTDRSGLVPVPAPMTGYIRHVDAGQLQACAEAGDTRALVLAPTGTFLAAGEAMALAGPGVDQEAVCAAFTMGRSRTFDQDPLFGIEVMSEIAERALSPGVNDPATAVDVVGRLTRLLLSGVDRDGKSPRFDRVHIPPITARDLCRSAFAAIARDAGAAGEVHEALQSALRRLAETGDEDMVRAARAEAERALAFAGQAITWDADLERVRAAGP